MVVTCVCGWTARGREERVIDAMQVHCRQIHGLELTRQQVVARATGVQRRGASDGDPRGAPGTSG